MVAMLKWMITPISSCCQACIEALGTGSEPVSVAVATVAVAVAAVPTNALLAKHIVKAVAVVRLNFIVLAHSTGSVGSEAKLMGENNARKRITFCCG